MKNIIESICNEILANVPEIKTCFVYEKNIRKFKAPAIFLEVPSYEVGDMPATDELALVAIFEARLVVDSNIEHAYFYSHGLITKLAHFINLNNFNQNITPATLKSISEDAFRPEFDNYLCWLVEWSHELYIGKNIFDETGFPPHEIIIKDVNE